ncbi:HAD-superfamily subfamily IIA hydrolase [Thecamonas trahens ATCC 50062]|uniref:HAD-superfamily subfamily IIA hydrolase n=1 Tax=Thecamonas trahens ATCC 50062 TaxID=461836 RepID=A0A0L0DAQ3_THETB|nr:HAD-superfamily subfamily IIA hydrolase [Thecamonas trahens ATCC 50062]KNC49439.1 HAD-superfamily subfamily IIA hydrolase [Thecamonas trahens ATCC 50062]|eukprot:XP_013757861.1 HAD-superfamily subfamily IIA hydrolase [Thecamonas trahens ATCC 50062]
MAGTAQTGVVLDIDGVLLRGGEAVPGAAEALQRLAAASPSLAYVFVTNGGGAPEALKAGVLAKALGVPELTPPDRILLSSSPMASLAPELGSARVLAVGRGPSDFVSGVLANYGFTNVVTAQDLLAECPFLVPQWTSNPSLMAADGAGEDAPGAAAPPTLASPDDPIEPFDAILIIHEPEDWGPVLQLLLDVLLSVDGSPSSRRQFPTTAKQPVPLYVANPDFAYTDAWAHPRLTSGAFLTCLTALYARATGGSQELEATLFGKPEATTYAYAEAMLRKVAGLAPALHIAGANAAGEAWTSILVHTGVFCGAPGENAADHPADHVVPSIVEAVDLILSKRR